MTSPSPAPVDAYIMHYNPQLRGVLPQQHRIDTIIKIVAANTKRLNIDIA